MSLVCPASRYGRDEREEDAVHDPVTSHVRDR